MNDTTNQEATNEENANTEQGSVDQQPAHNEEGETAASSEDDVWGKAFPDQTPESVKNELQEWKQHSREWEKRAKSWKKQLDSASDSDNAKADELAVRLDEVEMENVMFRDLIALEIESGVQVPFSDLADSIAFRNAYAALDRDDEGFAEKLQGIVDKRVQRGAPSRLRREVETSGRGSEGKDLYDRMYNKK